MKKYYYKLTDICDFQGGSQPPKNQWINHYKDGYIRMLQIRDFTQNRVDEEFVKITNTTKMCSKEDILIARYGASIGKILTGLEGAYNVAIMKSIPNENILYKKYLYYYFNTQYFQHNIKNVGSRAAQAGFNKSELENMQIYVPSLEIQGKIVEVLDKAQELIDKRKEQIEALDELVKSRFIEMFGDPVLNIKGWSRKKMNDIAPSVSYKGDFNENKIWLLNLDMVESETGNIIMYNYVSKDQIGNSTCTFDTTNVLYSKLRPYLNKVVIPNEIGYATSEMIPLQPIKKIINRYYLTYMLRNKSFVAYISEKVSGAKMPRVTMNEFRDFKVPIPPIELQNKFAEFVNQVDKLKLEMENSLKKLEDNFNSLMQKAFKGELF